MIVTLQLEVFESQNCPAWQRPTPESVATDLKALLNGDRYDDKAPPEYWFARDVRVIGEDS